MKHISFILQILFVTGWAFAEDAPKPTHVTVKPTSIMAPAKSYIDFKMYGDAEMTVTDRLGRVASTKQSLKTASTIPGARYFEDGSPNEDPDSDEPDQAMAKHLQLTAPALEGKYSVRIDAMKNTTANVEISNADLDGFINLTVLFKRKMKAGQTLSLEFTHDPALSGPRKITPDIH